MSDSSDPTNFDADHNEASNISSEELQGIAERLKSALEELFAAKAVAEHLSATDSLPDEAQSSLGTARTESDTNLSKPPLAQDRRLYVPHSQNWQAGIQTGAREYCCIRQPGQDWFHLLVNGEIYLQFGTDKMCLNCAFQQRKITDDRLYWQTSGRRNGMIETES
ncbi:MAG: hypothetical protein NT013_06545 [Planctomycetia bacterium]|nr:hypothetical protein [Planctomycetia bacterium]